MKKRVDFLMRNLYGDRATSIRAYIDYKRVKDLKCIDVAEGYDFTFKKGSFYMLWTVYANERDIEVENQTLKISRK